MYIRMPSTKNDNQPPTVAPWRDSIHEVIFGTDTRAGKIFDVVLIVAICLSVLVVILSTLPAVTDNPNYQTIFLTVEWVFTILFTAEYVTRLVVTRRPLRYATSFFGIIDLLAILPAFIGIIIPRGEHLLVVRTMRLIRIFRVFKLARYLSEAAALRHAFYISRHKIAVFITTVMIVVLIASALMHVVESHAKNEDFESMPSAIYWAIITMTTVGYGDIVPVTAFGKATTAVLVLVGYSLIIIPTGILSAEIAGAGGMPTPKRACKSCSGLIHDPDAQFCKHCGKELEESTSSLNK